MRARSCASSRQIGQPAHQAALAAAAFQQLRLEHVARPLRRLGGRALARAQQHAARDGEPVAAQQGFSVDLRQAHNAATLPLRPSAHQLGP